MRQFTIYFFLSFYITTSKLPMRQFTAIGPSMAVALLFQAAYAAVYVLKYYRKKLRFFQAAYAAVYMSSYWLIMLLIFQAAYAAVYSECYNS